MLGGYAPGGATGEEDRPSVPGTVVEGANNVDDLTGSPAVARGGEPTCVAKGASIAVTDDATMVSVAVPTAQAVALEVDERGWASAVEGGRSVEVSPTDGVNTTAASVRRSPVGSPSSVDISGRRLPSYHEVSHSPESSGCSKRSRSNFSAVFYGGRSYFFQ